MKYSFSFCSFLSAFFISVMIIVIAINEIQAAKYIRFKSRYNCEDSTRKCTSRGKRIIEGLEAERDCWDWSYSKVCDYPSVDDCGQYNHCYFVRDVKCFLKDSLGNCIDMKREFSCKDWEVIEVENETARTGFYEKRGKDSLICKGVLCIDGHCVDKSYMTNGEMMDSLSKLYATSEMNPDKKGKFNLFEGSSHHCNKKIAGYTNCCRADIKGWGKNLGAKCSKDENILSEMRAKNLCVYVGAESVKKAGLRVATKHRYCCFGNMLDKVIQVEGRKQLRKSFGTGSRPNCRGLTLEEIQKIDWSKVDFGEFIEDLKIKFAKDLKLPTAGDLTETIANAIPDIRQYDGDPNNPDNNLSGWSTKIANNSENKKQKDIGNYYDKLESEKKEKEHKKREEKRKREEARRKREAERKSRKAEREKKHKEENSWYENWKKKYKEDRKKRVEERKKREEERRKRYPYTSFWRGYR